MLTEFFRSKGYLVIFIQHNGTEENWLIPNSDDWKLLSELVVKTSDKLINKTANDSFYNTPLEEILAKHNIQELFITGCATDFCVDTTIKSALNKDYKITVVSDGHTTATREYVNAETIINYFNWIWSDMTPTKHRIAVMKMSEIRASLAVAE